MLREIHQELVAIRKALAGKGRPNLITVKALTTGGGWDTKKVYDRVIDANRIRSIEPFRFWTGEPGNTDGAYIDLGKDEGLHVLMTPAEIKALAEK